ncbi:hypothetical protein ACJX0J_015457, partial [Zea mays]
SRDKKKGMHCSSRGRSTSSARCYPRPRSATHKSRSYFQRCEAYQYLSKQQHLPAQQLQTIPRHPAISAGRPSRPLMIHAAPPAMLLQGSRHFSDSHVSTRTGPKALLRQPPNNATSSQPMSNTASTQQFPPQPPLWPTGYMQQPPMDYNMMANINFPNPGQGPTTMWAPMQTANSTSQSTMIPASQSAVYWNHYLNFVRNPLGSVDHPPFADSYPPSNTSTPLQGSNNIPSLPVNLESDAEHSVQDINSPEKNAAPVLKNKKSKEQNFTAPEDLLLCTTWLQISSDPIVHTGQRREGLWARIEKRYNEQRGQYPCRVNRALSSRWDKIRADVSKFSGYYARVLRENQSGLTDDDK